MRVNELIFSEKWSLERISHWTDKFFSGTHPPNLSLSSKNDLKMVDLKLPLYRNNLKDLETIEQVIQNSDDKLKDNYLGLSENLHKFISFTVIYLKGSPIAFSGIMSEVFPTGYGRVLSRTYLLKKFRSQTIAKRLFPDVGTGLMLPYQVDVCKKIGITKIFISIEGRNRIEYCRNLAKNLSIYQNERWVHLPGFYNVCRRPKGSVNPWRSCWQNIVLLDLATNSEFNLPYLTEAAYQEKFRE